MDEAGNSWQSQPHGAGERLSAHRVPGSVDRFKSRTYNAENDKKCTVCCVSNASTSFTIIFYMLNFANTVLSFTFVLLRNRAANYYNTMVVNTGTQYPSF
jgi:hypothetical protein